MWCLLSQEEELGRPVSFAEVFIRTHTLPDGSFVDQKAKDISDTYQLSVEEELRTREADNPETLADPSLTLTIEEQNDIFLKVISSTHFLSVYICVY